MNTHLVRSFGMLGMLPSCVVAVALGAAACGSRSASSGDGGDVSSDRITSEGGRIDGSIDASEAVSLTIDPPMSVLHVTDRTVMQLQTLTAHAHTLDGRDVVVTASWSLDRADVLTVDAAGTATTTNTSGGDVVVTATYGALSATAQVRVILEFGVTLPGTPPGTAALFPPGTMPTVDATRTPAWLYPSSETIFPQNVYKVLFQWRPSGNDRFRVNFDSDRLHLALYTDGVHATCAMAGTGLSCFEPDLDVWRFIAGTNPHAAVQVTVDAARSTAPGAYYRSAPITLGFSRGPVPGAIYYWSTTARGVRRATVGDSAPTNFLTPTEASGNCVACHTLSRRGNRMGADVGGNNLWIVEVSPAFPPPRLVTNYMGANIPSFWSTFSFDETRVITAARGVLTLRNEASGAPINTIPTGTGQFGTQPDWSPDGTLVAFARSTSNRDRGVATARIAVIDSMAGDTWGAARALVGTGVAGDTNQFPSFSWDSRWIAYTHSTGNGENDNTTDLWLVARDGTGSRALSRANTIVNGQPVTTATIEDSMSTWAPSGVPDDYAWVAFTSNRDYGGVLSSASSYGRHKQLWVAAIDLTMAPTGGDPSYPAFRIPFTELTEDTHRPFWAEDRVSPAPDAGVDAGTDASSAEAGTPDAACLPMNADCSSGLCCTGLTCWDNGSGMFTCQVLPP